MSDTEQKSPLKWELLETLENGDVKAEISASRLPNGKRIYSTGFRRIVRTKEGVDTGKTNGFFRGNEDFVSIKALCDEVKYWIDADKDEQHKAKTTTVGRRPFKPAH
jgi:hypothetical protein